MRPRVLMVTGAYYPEIAGGALQARELIRVLRHAVEFRVLTTSGVATETTEIDGVPVRRVGVDIHRAASRWLGLIRLVRAILALVRAADVVHLQGFSRKNILITAAAKLFGARVVLTLQTGVHDDAAFVKARGRLGFWSFERADVIVAVSQALRGAAERAGIPSDRLRWVPNGVDTSRFRPVTAQERRALRRRLSLPEEATIVLFVGFFSHEKGPQRLFDAWKQLPDHVRNGTVLLFIGQTRLPHTEVDPALAETIRRETLALRQPALFVERTLEIECYYQAADLFVLPSTREGCPNAVLEAMAVGMPVVTTRLAGITDALITDRVNGRLVPADDVTALRAALLELLSRPAEAAPLGAAARETACGLFSLDLVSRAYLKMYTALGAS